MHAMDFGFTAIELGCGRKKTDDKIDYLAGIILNRKCGDEVKKGELLYELYAESEEKLAAGVKRSMKAVEISSAKPVLPKLIIDILE